MISLSPLRLYTRLEDKHILHHSPHTMAGVHPTSVHKSRFLVKNPTIDTTSALPRHRLLLSRTTTFLRPMASHLARLPLPCPGMRAVTGALMSQLGLLLCHITTPVHLAHITTPILHPQNAKTSNAQEPRPPISPLRIFRLLHLQSHPEETLLALPMAMSRWIKLPLSPRLELSLPMTKIALPLLLRRLPLVPWETTTLSVVEALLSTTILETNGSGNWFSITTSPILLPSEARNPRLP